MKKNQTELTYLRAAVQNASAAGLVIILFDMLIGDLECAISAIDERNIEKRSTELKHAFLVLQQLEGSLDMENGGQAATTFSRFYSAIRTKLLEAHIKVNPDIMRRQIELLLDVRQAWQQVDKPNLSSAAIPQGGLVTQNHNSAPDYEHQTSSASWTA
jgi:flagellar protein FliS